MSDVALTVTVVDDAERWRHLQPQWNELLERSASRTFFLTWEWLSSWSRCCLGKGRTLFILAFHEDLELVGIAPFYIEARDHRVFTLREVRFLGTPDSGSDYVDVFAKSGKEKIVAEAVLDYLVGAGRGRWDVLHLTDVPADALFLLHFYNRVQMVGKHCEITFSAYCPVVTLPVTEEELLAGLSSSRKKRFTQDLRILQRQEAVTHSVLQGGAIAGKLDQFISLYDRKNGVSGLKIREIMSHYLAYSGQDRFAQLDLLCAGERLIAGFLHFNYGDTRSLYLMAVDKEFIPKISLGNVFVGLCLKSGVGRCRYYDFLRGAESYKFHWATGGRTTMQLLLWQRRPAALGSALARLVKHAGKLLVR